MCVCAAVSLVLVWQGLEVNCSASEPLKVMISGAPASGKGTQCESIVKKVSFFYIFHCRIDPKKKDAKLLIFLL